MRSSFVKLVYFLLFLSLSLVMVGCSPAKPAVDPNLIWAVELSKFEVKDKLEVVETVVQYVGSFEEVHQQFPNEGNVYLIMKITVTKQGTDTTPFDWSKLVVRDAAGNTYPRNSNDSFLEQYKYTPRMTGLEIKFGINEGWVCYEIPVAAADGKLDLVYQGEGSQQEIVVKD
jgi:hypothetical protein